MLNCLSQKCGDTILQISQPDRNRSTKCEILLLLNHKSRFSMFQNVELADEDQAVLI